VTVRFALRTGDKREGERRLREKIRSFLHLAAKGLQKGPVGDTVECCLEAKDSETQGKAM
jgi:hypothetical protein